jgi:hypothetical protein
MSNGINCVNGINGGNGVNGHHSYDGAESTTDSHDEKNKRIQELEAELIKKNHYTAELVAQVDEKDRRVEQLEAHVTSQRRLIAALEDNMKDLKLQLNEVLTKKSVDTPETTESSKDSDLAEPPVEDRIAKLEDNIKALTLQINSATPVESSAHTETIQAPKHDVPAEKPDHMQDTSEAAAGDSVDGTQDTQSTTAKPNDAMSNGSVDSSSVESTESPSKTKSPGKTVALTESLPKTESPGDTATLTDSWPKPEAPGKKAAWGTGDGAMDSPKQTKPLTPVVPPAPKLNFPIKKVPNADREEKTLAWVTQPVNTSGSSGRWSFGSSEKDIRDMALHERNELFKGPSVNVLIGTENLRGFPKHMLMAVSPKIRDYFLKNPNETYIAFPAGSIAVPVMQILRDYFRSMGIQKSVYSLKLRYNWQQDLAIRRDCCFLGMDKYVAHFTRQYCDKVREGFVGFENIALIEKNTTDDDALFNCLANNLATMRRRGNLPDPEKFEAFLKQHPRLAQAIGSIDTRIHANREKRQARQNSDAGSPLPNGRQFGRKVNGNGNRAGSPPNSYAAKASVKLATNGN